MTGLGLSADGRWLATYSYDSLRVWDARGVESWVAHLPESQRERTATLFVHDDGAVTMHVNGGWPLSVLRSYTADGELAWEQWLGFVGAAAFTSDGRAVLAQLVDGESTATIGGRVEVRGRATGEVVARVPLRPPGSQHQALAVSADDRIGAVSYGDTVELFWLPEP